MGWWNKVLSGIMIAISGYEMGKGKESAKILKAFPFVEKPFMKPFGLSKRKEND